MTTWHHAWLAVTRRSTKSLTLGLIITLISAAFLLQGFMTASLAHVRQSAEETITPGFTLTSPSGHFRTSAATDLDVPHVTNVSLTMTASADTNSGDVLPVTGADDLTSLPEFAEATITAGQAPASPGEALIADVTAAQMNVSVGDTVSLTSPDASLELSVAGIYSSTQSSRSATVFTDVGTAQKLAGKDAISSARFDVDSRDHVAAAIAYAKDHVADGLTLENNTAHLEPLLDSVTSLATVATRILWALLGAAAVILALVLSFWTRARIRQVGVMLAIGTPKRRVVAQYVIELGIILAASFVTALLVCLAAGRVISRVVTDSLSASLSNISAPGVLSTLGSATLPSLGAVALLIALSLMIAIIPIIRLHPSRLLAAMS